MDTSRFDALSRQMALPGNRRGVLKLLAGVIVGSGVAAVIADDADAVSCRAATQSCTRGNQCCSGICNDARHPDRAQRSTCACESGPAGEECRALVACFASCPSDQYCLSTTEGPHCVSNFGSSCAEGNRCTGSSDCNGDEICLSSIVRDGTWSHGCPGYSTCATWR